MPSLRQSVVYRFYGILILRVQADLPKLPLKTAESSGVDFRALCSGGFCGNCVTKSGEYTWSKRIRVCRVHPVGTVSSRELLLALGSP